MLENKFKKRLLSNENLIGVFLNIPNPILIEIMQRSGMDFTIIDAEHAPFNPETIDQCVRTGEFCGLEPMIRVHENAHVYIQRAMDLSPAAILVPQVATKQDAEMAVKAAYFKPKGERGLSPNIRFAGYSADNTPDLTRRANDNACVVGQLEGVEGLRNLEEILTVEDLDAIYIGPYDLSVSMGIPGELNHPRIQEEMKNIVSRARDHGKIVGSFCQTLEMAQKWHSAGIRFLTIGVDTAIIYQSFADIAASFKE